MPKFETPMDLCRKKITLIPWQTANSKILFIDYKAAAFFYRKMKIANLCGTEDC